MIVGNPQEPLVDLLVDSHLYNLDAKGLRVSLGECLSNANSAGLATSSCGSQKSKSQYMATRLITRTGS